MSINIGVSMDKVNGDNNDCDNYDAELVPYLDPDKIISLKKLKFGPINQYLRTVYSSFYRVLGKYSFQDQINISCVCEPPIFFLQHGVMISHPFGITLSIDEIGCDVNIGQNTTVGTNGKNMDLGGFTTNHKPRIGNLVRVYSHAIISGEVTIGDCVIVAANALVTKDVPSKSIVYGDNVVKPLQKHHVKYLENVLHHCHRQYVLVPGIMYKDEQLFVNNTYLQKRSVLLNHLGDEQFSDILFDIF